MEKRGAAVEIRIRDSNAGILVPSPITPTVPSNRGQPSAQLSRLLQDSKEANDIFDDQVPEWSGVRGPLPRWDLDMDTIAERSVLASARLGQIGPARLRLYARAWWLLLPIRERLTALQSWSALRSISVWACKNGAFMEQMSLRAEALTCRYRDANGPYGSPLEYFERKFALLDTLGESSGHALVQDILLGAPRRWSRVLDADTIRDTFQPQVAIQTLKNTLHPTALNSIPELPLPWLTYGPCCYVSPKLSPVL